MYERGGVQKIPAAWALQIYPHTPLLCEMPFGQTWGGPFILLLENGLFGKAQYRFTKMLFSLFFQGHLSRRWVLPKRLVAPSEFSALRVRVANPLSPYIQKRPEPQICPKFVPTIVFRGSNQGDPNLSKICRKFQKRQFPDKFSNFRQIFETNLGSPIGTPKYNRRDKLWTNLGFGAFLNAVRGKRVHKVRVPE